MRLYDENGICIGSVREKNLRNSEESIMPVSITVTPAKHFILPNGFLLMVIGAGIAVLSMLLSIFAEIFDFPKGIVSFLSAFGLCGTESYLFVPLAYLIQLAALFLLTRIHYLSFLFVACMYAEILYTGLIYVILRPEYWDERNYFYILDIFFILLVFGLYYIGFSNMAFLRIPYFWILLSIRLLVAAVLFAFAPDSVSGWVIGILYYLFETVYWWRVNASLQKEIL